MNARVVAVKRRERRRDRRSPVVIRSAMGSWDAVVTDISSGGIGGAINLVQKDSVKLQIGQQIELMMPREGQGDLALSLEITRTSSEDLTFGARFIDISDAQYRLIESYVTGRPRS